MALSDTLVSTLAGGALATLGTWLGTRWQGREAKRSRLEQYERDDRLRHEADRRALYARFARLLTEVLDLVDAPEAYDKLEDLERLYWEIAMIGSADVVYRARSAIMAVATGLEVDPELLVASFVRSVREELGLAQEGLPRNLLRDSEQHLSREAQISRQLRMTTLAQEQGKSRVRPTLAARENGPQAARAARRPSVGP